MEKTVGKKSDATVPSNSIKRIVFYNLDLHFFEKRRALLSSAKCLVKGPENCCSDYEKTSAKFCFLQAKKSSQLMLKRTTTTAGTLQTGRCPRWTKMSASAFFKAAAKLMVIGVVAIDGKSV
jgi:hypothetical protein